MPDHRAKLERLRLGKGIKSGPLADGLSEPDRIVLVSFYDPRICQRFRRALQSTGIPSWAGSDGIKTTVSVSYAHREMARQVLTKLQEEFPDRPPRGIRRELDFTIFGSLLGSVAGVTSILYSPNLLIRALVWGGFIGTGLVLGYFLDRCQRSYRYIGRLQFSVMECFVFLTLAALIASFWKFVTHVLPS